MASPKRYSTSTLGTLPGTTATTVTLARPESTSNLFQGGEKTKVTILGENWMSRDEWNGGVFRIVLGSTLQNAGVYLNIAQVTGQPEPYQDHEAAFPINDANFNHSLNLRTSVTADGIPSPADSRGRKAVNFLAPLTDTQTTDTTRRTNDSNLLAFLGDWHPIEGNQEIKLTFYNSTGGSLADYITIEYAVGIPADSVMVQNP